jgi:hypothetical protein
MAESMTTAHERCGNCGHDAIRHSSHWPHICYESGCTCKHYRDHTAADFPPDDQDEVRGAITEKLGQLAYLLDQARKCTLVGPLGPQPEAFDYLVQAEALRVDICNLNNKRK